MNKYLIEILKLRTSVTLPGFGALMIANSRTGKIVLNQLLKYDDKVLAKFIAEKESIELQEAQNMVSKFIKEIDLDLSKGETYDIFQFGKLSKTENGSIVFDMDESMAKKQTSPIVSKPKVEKKTIEAKKVDAKIKVGTKKTEPKVETKKETTKVMAEAPRNIYKPDVKKAVIKDATKKVVEKALPKKDTVKKTIEKVVPNKETAKKVIEKPKVVKEVTKTVNKATEKLKVGATVAATTVVNEVKETSKNVKETVALSKDKLKEEKLANEKWKKSTAIGGQELEKEKKRRIWPIILLLLLAGLAFGAYKFQNKIKSMLGMGTTEHVVDEDVDISVENSETNNGTVEADIVDSLSIDNEVIADEIEEGSEIDNETEELSEVINETEAIVVEEVAETVVDVPTSINGSYHIVGGAFGEKSNAEAFANKTNGTVLGRFNGMYQVALKSFDTRAEANSALSSVSSEHSGAWIFKYEK